MTDRSSRSDYPHIGPLQTRWADNDIYGHINNVAYYGFFDTIVNDYLIAKKALGIHDGETIGLVVESGCRYHAPASYPDRLDGALRVASIGNSSVRYELAIFKEAEDLALVEGHFVHVYVDRATRKPQSLPSDMRSALDYIKAG